MDKQVRRIDIVVAEHVVIGLPNFGKAPSWLGMYFELVGYR